MKAEGNLRGKAVRFAHPETGRDVDGIVLTRIRGARWMILSSALPASFRRPDGSRRIVLERDDFYVLPLAPPRARSPLEMAIDRACGFDARQSGEDA